MFGWLRKKSEIPLKRESENDANVKSQALDAPPQSVDVQCFTESEVRTLFEAKFKSSAHASVFYAQCAGMKEGTLGSHNTSEYIDKILRSEVDDFVKSDISLAANYWLAECFKSLASKYWEMSFSAIQNGKNPDLRDLLLALRSKILALNAREPFHEFTPGVDINAIALDVCLQRKEEDLLKLRRAVDEKIDVLRPIFARLRNTSVNKYGDYDPSQELDEIAEFIDYNFQDGDFDFYYNIRPNVEILAHIDRLLDASRAGDIPIDGIEFEHWCAELIRGQGWSTSVSKASGDQGVDVVAKRDGVQVAIQCKRYSSPVGNKAVQEAFAGMKFSNSDFACVVSTAGFTSSARQAAAATEVWLLDATEINGFSRRYGFDDMGENENEGEEMVEDLTYLSFKTSSECSVGSILRSSLTSSLNRVELDDLELSEILVNNILTSIDEDTGSGEFSCSVDDAARLIFLIEISLSGKLVAHEKNISSFKQSRLYDGPALDTVNLGDVLRATDLFSDERLGEMELVVDAMIEDLPDGYAALAKQHVQDIRAGRIQ